jgi:hypothetical protein
LIFSSIIFAILKKSINIEELEYIFDKIILSQNLKICAYISKLRLWVELFGDFFLMVNDIDIHWGKKKPFRSLYIYNEIPLKKCVFCIF